MRHRLGLVLVAGLVLLPTLAWAGRIFQWTDAKGEVHATDNLWQLPPAERQRYLDLIEDEARRKLTPQQIKDLKEAGNWPPLEFIRPPNVKKAEESGSLGFKITGSDLDVQRSIFDEFRFQWDSYHAEKQNAESLLANAKSELTSAQEAVERARMDDMVYGRVGEMAKLPEAEKRLVAAQQALQAAEDVQRSLPQKHRALMMGERAYHHPGEDGGPGSFGWGR